MNYAINDTSCCCGIDFACRVWCVCICCTFLRWTAGQGGEGQVHDVAADDGGLQQSWAWLFWTQGRGQSNSYYLQISSNTLNKINSLYVNIVVNIVCQYSCASLSCNWLTQSTYLSLSPVSFYVDCLHRFSNAKGRVSEKHCSTKIMVKC